MDKSDARHLFVQTMEGAAQMLKTGNAEPLELRRRVTSPISARYVFSKKYWFLK